MKREKMISISKLELRCETVVIKDNGAPLGSREGGASGRHELVILESWKAKWKTFCSLSQLSVLAPSLAHKFWWGEGGRRRLCEILLRVGSTL